jgi:hypothetical protein
MLFDNNALLSSGGEVTTWEYARLSMPKLLVAATVNENEPAAVGVPIYAPVVAFSVRPGGNVPEATLHITVSPEETNVAL